MTTAQLTVADVSGPASDEFLRRVQEASAGPPWYMPSPPIVRTVCIVCGRSAIVCHRTL